MQDDNLQHMEYLLTKEAFQNWFNEISVKDFEGFFNLETLPDFKMLYLKEHGLPLGSVIKE